MHLTKQQIESFVRKVGQPKASVLLSRFFNSYRGYLDSSDVADLYDDIYLSKIDSHQTYLVVEQKYKINIYNRYTYEYLMPKLIKNKDIYILDIGCGSGDFALAVATSGAKVIGVDFSKTAIKSAKAKLARDKGLNCDFICGDISVLSSLGKEILFDYIVLNDVIEHLSDRELGVLINKINPLFKSDGEIVIHTPNGLALSSDTDSNIFQSVYKVYLRMFRGWLGHERTVEQIYYEQVHISIKSYCQIKNFFNKYGYKTSVLYDERGVSPLMRQLSSNMLVIARIYKE